MRPTATVVFIAINVAVFLAMQVTGRGSELQVFSIDTLVNSGALVPDLVAAGQVWRVITAMFIHIAPVHLLMNMAALFQAGRVLEGYLGIPRYVALYLLAGLGGSVASLGWNWGHPIVSAGASGAIAGLIGGGIVVGQLVGGAHGSNYRNAMLRWAAIVIVYGFVAHADNAAHVGGLATGLLLAWLLARTKAATNALRTGRPDAGSRLVDT